MAWVAEAQLRRRSVHFTNLNRALQPRGLAASGLPAWCGPMTANDGVGSALCAPQDRHPTAANHCAQACVPHYPAPAHPTAAASRAALQSRKVMAVIPPRGHSHSENADPATRPILLP